jgi:hypothetical protein
MTTPTHSHKAWTCKGGHVILIAQVAVVAEQVAVTR